MMMSGRQGSSAASYLGYLEVHLTSEKVQREKDLITRMRANGGQTNPMEWFAEKVCREEDMLYHLVKDQYMQVKQVLKQLNLENMRAGGVGKGTLYLAHLADEERQSLRIDQILPLYLIDLAEQVIVNAYKAATVFIELYRNCLNQLGWDKLANYKRIDSSMQPNKGMLPLFTMAKDAELIPELANDFVMSYLPMKCNVFDRRLAIDMVEHLCLWLFNRRLTSLKLT